MLSGCGGGRAASPPTSPTTAHGVLTGRATPCIGPVMASGHIPSVPVTVKVTHYGKTIARQTVTGSHVYRLVVMPGHYELSSNAGGTQPASVTVRASRVVRVTFVPPCS